MRIRAKVTILLALLFAALIATQWAIQRQQILPRFVGLERDSARTDMQRVAMAIEREQQSLTAQAADWGNWQELWRYVSGRNPGFVAASLTDVSFRNARLDYMAVLGSDGHFYWSHGPYSRHGAAMPVRLNGDNKLDPAWRTALAGGQPVSGLIATDRGVLIAAGTPILDGFGRGPSRGMVIMGRLLNETELHRLGTQAQVQLDMRPWTRDPVELTETDATTRIERTFYSRSGTPLLVMGIDIPRTISHRGTEALYYSVLLLATAAAIVLLALYVQLSRIVLDPLSRITRHAQRIARSDDLSARLGQDRRDELGALARAFDDMVERLEGSRRELADRSYESGVAENARGILHNIGNAITPLSVNIASLEQGIAGVSTADLELALAELDAGTADPQRRSDLGLFVRLSALELARTLRQGSQRVEAIASQVRQIQAVLAEQRRHKQSEPVRQSIAPVELVGHSLQHIAPAHRERLDVQPSLALAGIESLSLPCTTLGMVIANLAQNAAEAAAQAGIARVRLRIDGGVVEHEGGHALRLCISDDGPGVAPAQMPRLFQKGFSTKPESTNSGLGLHWCANTLRALGGTITVAANPEGTGLRFEIFIPLATQCAITKERAA